MGSADCAKESSTRMKNDNTWIVICIVAFIGGIVSNIIVPKRRGLLGFAAAGVVSIFCGGVAGICSSVFGIQTEGQIFVAAIIGVMSDRILTIAMTDRITNVQNNSGNSTGVQGTNNNVGDK